MDVFTDGVGRVTESTWLMLSKEREAGAGLRGIGEIKVRDALCSLISIKQSQQDGFGLGCSAARESAAVPDRWLPTKARLGTAVYQAELRTVSLCAGA